MVRLLLRSQVRLSDAARGKRLLFLAAGARGEVQPLVALAAGCKKAGFEVLVVARGRDAGFFQDFGVEAADCDAFEDVLGQSSTESTPVERQATGGGMPGQEEPLSPAVLRSMWDYASDFRPDLVVSGLPCLVACHAFAERLGVPAVECNLRPMVPTREQCSPLGEPESWPSYCHYFLWLAFRKRVWRGYLEEQLPALQVALQTRGLPCDWGSFRAHLLDTVRPVAPGILASSPAVAGLPSDVPPELRNCGFGGFLVVGRQEQLTKADEFFGCRAVLRSFLDGGGKPVYFGWGPVVAGSPKSMAELAVGTAMACDRRAIILCGAADLGPALLDGHAELQAYAEAHTIFVRSAPHEWLFPQCAAVVHHGGLGTTACSLRSGVPTVVAPSSPEQRAQAAMVSRLGAGASVPSLEGLQAAALAAVVQKCLESQAMVERCAELSATLQKEDGVKAGVEHLDKLFSDHLATGSWKLASEQRRLEKVALAARAVGSGSSCWAWWGRAARGGCGRAAEAAKKRLVLGGSGAAAVSRANGEQGGRGSDVGEKAPLCSVPRDVSRE